MHSEATDPNHFQTARKRTAAYDPAAEVVGPRHLRLVVGLTSVTVWRLRRAGLFPAPLRLSPGRIGWRRSVLDSWLAEREAAK